MGTSANAALDFSAGSLALKATGTATFPVTPTIDGGTVDFSTGNSVSLGALNLENNGFT